MAYPVYDTKTFMATMPLVLGFTSSLVPGILSFGGMLVLWPTGIFWAVCALLLTMSCEGEINRQNNVSAFAKLSDPDYAKTQLTKQYLLEKLAKFDHQRARFISKNLEERLSEDEQKKACLFEEVLLIQRESSYAIGFRNRQGKYEEVDLPSGLITGTNFCADTKFIEDSSIILQLNSYLQTYAMNTDVRIKVSQDEYPLYIKYYIGLIRHIHLLQDSFDDGAVQQLEQDQLKTMTDNLKTMTDNADRVENLIKQMLFENLSEASDDTDRNELRRWITSEDQKIWQEKLVWQYFYLRIVGALSIISGMLITLGSSYLLLQAFTSIPFLMYIPASLSVFIIVPLAIISGLAYGFLFYNSLTDMLMDNPFLKLWDKMRYNTEYCTVKSKVFMVLSLLLFILTLVLTICSAGTWISVFSQSAPLFLWINIIPDLILKYAIPIFIGICELPFSLQNIANTLHYLEHHPKVARMLEICTEWYHGRLEFARIWAYWKEAFYQWGLDILGVSAAVFEAENWLQKCNPARILLALGKMLIALIIAAHFFCESVIDDRLANFPVYLAISLSIVSNTFQDSNYFLGDNHIDASNTAELLQERCTQSGGHDHDNILFTSVLSVLSEPLIWLGGFWSYSCADMSNKKTLEAHIADFKPHPKKTLTPQPPQYYTESDFNISLFKAKKDPMLLSFPTCCYALQA